MTTVNTQGDVGEAVRREMERNRRLRTGQLRRRAIVVVSPDSDPEPEPVKLEVENIQDLSEPSESEVQGRPEPDVEVEKVERPDANFGGKGAWYKYRLASGYSEDELKGKGRAALRDLDDR